MNIRKQSGVDCELTWSARKQHARPRRFRSMDGHYPVLLSIDPSNPNYRMTYCHEIAHLLLAPIVHTKWAIEQKNEFIYELLAWRLAKAFCKPEHWKESHVKKALRTYQYYPHPKIHWGKFRIVPLYSIRGIFSKIGKRRYAIWNDYYPLLNPKFWKHEPGLEKRSIEAIGNRIDELRRNHQFENALGLS